MRRQYRVSWQFGIMFLVLWLFMASIVLGVRLSVDENESDWAMITHKTYEFSLEYPTKWQAKTYGEDGFKGDKEFKLWIYRSLLDPFRVEVRYRAMESPALQDVITWSNERIERYKKVKNGGSRDYTELRMFEDMIGDQSVVRRIYTMSGLQIEEVYIARRHDMIIIALRTPESQFDSYKDEFERILNSFEPLQ